MVQYAESYISHGATEYLHFILIVTKKYGRQFNKKKFLKTMNYGIFNILHHSH